MARTRAAVDARIVFTTSLPVLRALRAVRVPRGGLGIFGSALPGPGLPSPSGRVATLAIRTITLVALIATAGYLTWRIALTVDLTVWWVSVPLIALEIHAAVGLALFAFSLWDVDRRPVVEDVATTSDRVAVLIPTYNESLEILTPTIAAAIAMRVDHETWVLDDGDRPAVAALARALGARYLTRPEHRHAKAGNLNHALGIVEADLVAVLDADHVASPDFLVRTLGYFADERVALVQTPQDFYNVDSFEHHAADRDERHHFHEQTLFYRVIQAGKNRWDAAFWCGTGAVVRVAALADVGGVATDTITEDIHTTIRLHRRGWRTVYHNEVLARGLAASDAATYQLQRHRWGTGAMQVLRSENPLVVPGLTIRQRLAYAATLLGWFDAWRSLGYLLLPIVVLVTGAVPIRADALTFAVAFGTTFILQQLALRALSRGAHRPILSIVFELVRMTPNILATLTLVTRRRVAFAVTPKGRTDDGTTRHPAAEPRLLRALAILSVAAAAWFALTLLDVTPVRYSVPWAAYATFGWLIVNVGLLVRAISRVRDLRYAGERRASVRFDTELLGTLDTEPCAVLDVSLTGARVAVFGSSVRADASLVVSLPDADVLLLATVRSVRPDATGRTIVGLEFLPDQHLARARVALALFSGAADSTDAASDAEPRAAVAGREAPARIPDRAVGEPGATGEPHATSEPAAA
jgi:cellulose synthase (UDP-forming)